MYAAGRGSDCEIAVIGAGPYGLAVAAHLKACDVRVRVFGDQMAYGSALAVREAGRQGKVHVVTMDSTIGCQGVGEGLIDVTFSFHVPEQGDQVVDALAMFFQMGEQGVKPGQFRTAVWSEWTKITRDNVGQPGLCYTGKT